MADHKSIALFLDGTWNNVNDNTSVWRAKSLCTRDDNQQVYYSAGVGTQRGERFAGGAFGIGIDQEVVNAYEWLVEHFEPGSRIFIFGFSRGAFTARSLAGFIAKCGLLRAGSPLSMKQLFARYRMGATKSILTLQKTDIGLTQEEQWLKKYSQPQPVFFQGVWDTVGKLGVPLPFLPRINSKAFAFLETDLRINQSYAYHALAIDEHREAFKPTLWKHYQKKVGDSFPPRSLADVEQRWFVGAHANVGGGYDNDLLPQAPLKWLMSKAQGHGLRFDTDIDPDDGADRCPVVDSRAQMLGGLYAIFNKAYDRPIGAVAEDSTDATVTTINETIDRSVFERWRADAGYRPKSLVDWAARLGKNPADFTTSITAMDAAELAD